MELDKIDIFDPFDINSAEFNCDLYLNRLMKESDISQLMEKEQSLHKDVKILDSEMQTLVYENYNKFINATETIREMSTNFDKMEHDLNELTINMDKITNLSEEIAKNLKNKRHDLTELADKHTILQKLQFLFELSLKMRSAISRKEYGEAVRYYMSAEPALQRYREYLSIKTIEDECQQILVELKQILHEQVRVQDSQHGQISECIELLLQLKESPEKLAQTYLEFSNVQSESELHELDFYIEYLTKCQVNENNIGDEQMVPMDILEFVDLACNGFLSNLIETIISFKDIFIKRVGNNFSTEDTEKIQHHLEKFIDKNMNKFFEKISQRYNLEKVNLDEISLFVRSLDRFFRRVSNLENSYFEKSYSSNAIRIIEEACDLLFVNTFNLFKKKFDDTLIDCRHSIATMSDENFKKHKTNLIETLLRFKSTLSEQIKSSLDSLLCFNNSKLSFYQVQNFKEKMKVKIREKIVVSTIYFMISYGDQLKKSDIHYPLQLYLIFTKLLLDFDSTIIVNLLNYVDGEFSIDKDSIYILTSEFLLKEKAKKTAQQLLDNYVKTQGYQVSLMLKKSMDCSDWLSTVETKAVRRVMKRIVDDISVIDLEVGQLFEEGIRTDRSSDSSRNKRVLSSMRMQSKPSFSKSNWSYDTNQMDNSLLSNIQKLFSEKIEIFTSCSFNKLSVTTGIIKILLKTYLECIRLCTFSKYGFQQVQIDTHFLQTQLWRFTSDENIVSNFLDEVMISAFQRCLEPVTLDNTVIEKICNSF